jgi:transposase
MTKRETATFLGVSVKTVERYAAAGRLNPKYKRGRTNRIAVFDEKEVKLLKKELETREGTGRRRSVPIELKLTFSLEEAAALSGLPETFLLKAIRNGELKASDKRSEGWNIKRWDLEDFVRGLS